MRKTTLRFRTLALTLSAATIFSVSIPAFAGTEYRVEAATVEDTKRAESNKKIIKATYEGIIADAPAGENGFGYDPILYLPELGKTSAELSEEEKNAISHRGKALRAMREILKNRLEEFRR